MNPNQPNYDNPTRANASALPAEITVEPLLPAGTRYSLPRRNQYIPAAFIFVFGLVVLGFMIHWTLGWIEGFQALFGPLGALAGLLASPGFMGAGAAVLFAGALAFGRCEVEISGGRLALRERCGWFRWTRSREIADITRLVVSKRNMSDEHSGEGIEGIRVETDGKPLWIAMGYPQKLLVALANQLAIDCGQEDVATEKARPMLVDMELASETGEPAVIERREQPAKSAIEFKKYSDGLELVVPARGFFKGPLGCFGVIWCSFMAVFTGGVILAGNNNQANDIWIFVAFISVFWLIGIGLMLAALNAGRSRASLAVAGDTLMALKIGIFGSTTQEWPRDQLTAIRVGESGVTVNDVPLLELQIYSRGQPKFTLLRGRDTDELYWVATQLRAALAAPAFESGNVDEQPADSKIKFAERHDGFEMLSPARGFLRNYALWHSLVWFSFMGLVTFLVGGGWQQQLPGPPEAAWAFVGVFWLIGIATFCYAIHKAMSWAKLTVAAGTLTVLKSGVFSSKTFEVPSNQILAIRADSTGTVINGVPQRELRIFSRGQPCYKLFAGRDVRELQWVAGKLREALNAPEHELELD